MRNPNIRIFNVISDSKSQPLDYGIPFALSPTQISRVDPALYKDNRQTEFYAAPTDCVTENPPGGHVGDRRRYQVCEIGDPVAPATFSRGPPQSSHCPLKTTHCDGERTPLVFCLRIVEARSGLIPSG